MIVVSFFLQCFFFLSIVPKPLANTVIPELPHSMASPSSSRSSLTTSDNPYECSIEIEAATRKLAAAIDSPDATMFGLLERLTAETEAIKQEARSLTMQSLCQLFLGIIQSDGDERRDWTVAKGALAERARLFISKIRVSKERVARTASNFIRDNAKVLIHGTSRVVRAVLVNALASRNKRFSLYITQGSPAESTADYIASLAALGLNPTVIPDSAVAHYMGQMDLVFCGAAAIAENGGVVSQIGTYQIAMIAQAHNTPFYVVAESFKFTKDLFPLKQSDVARLELPHPPLVDHYRALAEIPGTHIEHSFFDLTPPKYITLLITDEGVIPPSAVSDELIKLGQRLFGSD